MRELVRPNLIQLRAQLGEGCDPLLSYIDGLEMTVTIERSRRRRADSQLEEALVLRNDVTRVRMAMAALNGCTFVDQDLRLQLATMEEVFKDRLDDLLEDGGAKSSWASAEERTLHDVATFVGAAGRRMRGLVEAEDGLPFGAKFQTMMALETAASFVNELLDTDTPFRFPENLRETPAPLCAAVRPHTVTMCLPVPAVEDHDAELRVFQANPEDPMSWGWQIVSGDQVLLLAQDLDKDIAYESAPVAAAGLYRWGEPLEQQTAMVHGATTALVQGRTHRGLPLESYRLASWPIGRNHERHAWEVSLAGLRIARGSTVEAKDAHKAAVRATQAYRDELTQRAQGGASCQR